jgi:hypothetical protein
MELLPVDEKDDWVGYHKSPIAIGKASISI